MAQNSDALQEPSMDELLASIREIIEENTAIPPQDGQGRASFQNNAGRASQQSEAAAPGSYNRGGYDAAPPQLRQDIRLRNDKNTAPQPRSPQSGAGQHHNPNNGFYHNAPQNLQNSGAEYSRWDGHMPGAGAVPLGQQGASQPPQAAAAPQTRGHQGQNLNNGAINNAGRQNREFYPAQLANRPSAPDYHNQGAQNQAMQDAHSSEDALPVQDSMNALAERIGLRRAGGFSPPQDGQNKTALQSGHNFAQAPHQPISASPNSSHPVPAGNNGSQAYGAAQNRSAGNRGGNFSRQGNVYESKEAAPPLNGHSEEARPRFNPAAVAARYQENADKMQAGFEAKENGRPAQPKLRAENHEDSSRNADRAARAETSARGEPQPERVKPAGFDKNFPADVEHSAENLLRPFITEWLDEHFRDLFEKILREEVQRFIRSMRRGA